MGDTSSWIGSPAKLLSKPLDFFPRPSQSPEQRTDSIARLCLYTAILAGAYRRQVIPWAIGGLAVAIALTVFMGSAGSGKYEDANARPVDNTGPARGPGEGACTMPSGSNPFGNALLTDIGKPGFAPACSVATEGIAARQRAFFNTGLVRSIYDPYERQNSQRQWITMPSPTGIADTLGVRNFLYGTSLNCKGNMKDCSTKPTCKDGGGEACHGFFP